MTPARRATPARTRLLRNSSGVHVRWGFRSILLHRSLPTLPSLQVVGGGVTAPSPCRDHDRPACWRVSTVGGAAGKGNHSHEVLWYKSLRLYQGVGGGRDQDLYQRGISPSSLPSTTGVLYLTTSATVKYRIARPQVQTRAAPPGIQPPVRPGKPAHVCSPEAVRTPPRLHKTGCRDQIPPDDLDIPWCVTCGPTSRSFRRMSDPAPPLPQPDAVGVDPSTRVRTDGEQRAGEGT